MADEFITQKLKELLDYSKQTLSPIINTVAANTEEVLSADPSDLDRNMAALFDSIVELQFQSRQAAKYVKNEIAWHQEIAPDCSKLLQAHEVLISAADKFFYIAYLIKASPDPHYYLSLMSEILTWTREHLPLVFH